MTSVALAAGGSGGPTETPSEQQHAVAEASSETSVSADSRRDGQEALDADVQEACGHGDGGSACSVGAKAAHLTSATGLSDGTKEAENRGASALASAPVSTSESLESEKLQAAGLKGKFAAMTSKSPSSGAPSSSSLAALDVEPSDAWVGAAEVVSGNVAGVISDSAPPHSDASAPSSLPTLPAEDTARSVEAIIEALPPGFVRCPGCPMVSWNGSL